jgi:sugar phosphate isomerase/epimerase
MFPQANAFADPEDFAEVFARFPRLEFTLDTGHARIGGRGDRKAVEFIERFSTRLGHVHAGDNFGRRDDHLPIGAGTCDFKTIVKALKAVAYDQTVTLEVFSPDRDYLRISREKFAALYDAL